MTLSERIIEYRAREDISQIEFAERVGVNRSTIVKIENGWAGSRLTEAKIERVLKGDAMTVKDKTIQDQKSKIKGLEEEIKLAVECCKICRLCKYADADCSPTDGSCKPEWRGYNGRKK